TFTIDWLSKRVNNTTKKFLSNRYLHNTSCTTNFIAFFNLCIWPQNNDTNVTFFQVLGHSHHTIGKLHKLTGHDIIKSVSTSNTITNFDNCSDIANFNIRIKCFNLFFNQCTDFFSFNAHTISPLSSFVCSYNIPFNPSQFTAEGTIENRLSNAYFKPAKNRSVYYVLEVN